MKNELKNLLEFVMSGRRYEIRNPYMIPEVIAAQAALRAEEPDVPKIIVELEIHGDQSDALHAVNKVLDNGVFQDAIDDYGLNVASAVAR